MTHGKCLWPLPTALQEGSRPNTQQWGAEKDWRVRYAFNPAAENHLDWIDIKKTTATETFQTCALLI